MASHRRLEMPCKQCEDLDLAVVTMHDHADPDPRPRTSFLVRLALRLNHLNFVSFGSLSLLRLTLAFALSAHARHLPFPGCTASPHLHKSSIRCDSRTYAAMV